jgi:hypothetical protein
VAILQPMPPIVIQPQELLPWGQAWLNANNEKKKDRANAFTKKDGMDFGKFFNDKVGRALATMLGGIDTCRPNKNHLNPAKPDCVEIGECRVIGGIRPQNYDVCYRPDGPRFVFDGKTLNDADSVQKNYQNMINDLGTEATNVHTRFPYAIMVFMVVIPEPTLVSPQKEALTGCLERLASRFSPIDNPHTAEAISLIVWNPVDGKISADWPPPSSPLRIGRFSEIIERTYHDRYKGLPPHD